jgi:hypothetical protein
MGEDIEAKRRPNELRAITRELEQMSDWELERGLASSTAFDHDRRSIADRILGRDLLGRKWVSLFGYWR